MFLLFYLPNMYVNICSIWFIVQVGHPRPDDEFYFNGNRESRPNEQYADQSKLPQQDYIDLVLQYYEYYFSRDGGSEIQYVDSPRQSHYEYVDESSGSEPDDQQGRHDQYGWYDHYVQYTDSPRSKEPVDFTAALDFAEGMDQKYGDGWEQVLLGAISSNWNSSLDDVVLDSTTLAKAIACK